MESQSNSKSIIDKIDEYLWEDPNPQYTLHMAQSVNRGLLSLLRAFFLSYQLSLTLISPIYSPEPLALLAYMTDWACVACTLYFVGINICLLKIDTQDNESRSWRILWKTTHILLEIAASLEFMVFIFFWMVIFPVAYEYVFSSPAVLFVTLCLHFFTPTFIWIEVCLSFAKFYKRHIWILLGVGVLFGINNCIWTLTSFQAYPYIDWKTPLSYGLMLLSVLLTLAGFGVGMYLHQFKVEHMIEEVHKPLTEPLIVDGEVKIEAEPNAKEEELPETGRGLFDDVFPEPPVEF